MVWRQTALTRPWMTPKWKMSRIDDPDTCLGVEIVPYGGCVARCGIERDFIATLINAACNECRRIVPNFRSRWAWGNSRKVGTFYRAALRKFEIIVWGPSRGAHDRSI